VKEVAWWWVPGQKFGEEAESGDAPRWRGV